LLILRRFLESRAYREPNGELLGLRRRIKVLILMYGEYWYDFLIDLFLDRSMKLEVGEAQALLKEYTGPQYEIERHMTVITLLFI